MALALILNLILGIALVIGVLAPLVWAIVTQHRDEPILVAMPHETGEVQVRARRRGQRPRPQQLLWPAR